MCRLAVVVLSLLVVSGQQTATETRNSMEARQANAFKAFSEFRAIGDALRGGAERNVIAERFRTLAKTYPDTDRAGQARELADLLQQMAVEDARFRAPRNTDTLSQEQQIAFQIYRLRDVAAMDIFVPGSINVVSDSREPNSPAFMLRRIGKPAVPALIGSLADRRPTRSVGA